MKNWKIATLAIMFLIGLVASAQAKIAWEVTNSFTADTPTLDIATSFDGKHIFILSPGKVQIVSNKGTLEDTLDVDPAMDTISATGFDRAGIDNKIILGSKETGEIQQIAYNFIISINTQGSPFLGSASAPVSLVLFSDFQ